MSRRRRVLVLVQGALGDRLMGPEIRGWEMARAFAQQHDVTVAASVAAPEEREGIPVVPRTRRSIMAQQRRHDVIVGPVLPPYTLAANARCLRVADLYDPVDLEVGMLAGRRGLRAASQQRAGRRLHLRWADVIVCANERQLERTREDLGSIRRPQGPPELLGIPMGLPTLPSSRPAGHPLRDHFAAIGDGDPLILWWGSAWRWLDAQTAVEAVGLLARARPDVRLVITAGRPANAATDALNVTEEVRRLAHDRGLLDRHVFFFDDWIPFDDRHRYLADADVGITLHAATEEATLAARARYMDYLWGSLPAVLAEGDEVAGAMAAAGAARLVPPRDPAATAHALDRLLEAPATAAARARCRSLAESYRWPRLLEPLVSRVDAGPPARRTPRQAVSVTRQAGGYYARRVVDRCVGALPG